jgi:predicted nucleotidyltransferase
METIDSQVREVLASQSTIAFAVLFGSAATGQLRANSDIDLAVRFAPGAKPLGWDFGGLVAALELAMKRPVELVDLERATSSVLRLEIAKGVRVKGDQDEFVELRARAFRDWRDFGPRFRRCARAMAAKLIGQSGVAR